MKSGNTSKEVVMKGEEPVQGTRAALAVGLLAIGLAVALALVACSLGSHN
jgi:hypothetical protein